MTITINGPDGSTFNFPDETAPDVISGAMAKHYGPPTATAAPTEDVSALSAAQSLPIIGAYSDKAAGYLRHLVRGGTTAEHEAQIKQEIANYRQQHPIASTVGDLTIGSLPYFAVGGFAPAARALGMTGKLAQAAPAAAASGALIGMTDAAARGEDPGTGAIKGALTGAGGVVAGKAVGRLWDAARGMWVDRPRLPYTLDVNGRQVPVSESTLTRDPKIAGEEQDFLGAHDPIATQREAETKAAMQAAHGDFEARLDPTGQSLGTTSREAGNTAAADIVAQEQARAQADITRMSGVQADTGRLAQGLGGGVAPAAPTLDVGQTLGQRIRELFTGARAATRQAYDVAAAVPGAYNPLMMRNASETIRGMVNSNPNVVRVSARVTPAAHAAIDSIDEELQQALANAATRGDQLGPLDLEQVRKALVAQRRTANNTARSTGNWEDAHAVGRVVDAFNDWEQQIAQAPGGLLHGDPAQIQATRAAARAAHAQERATFSRRGPGDVVGPFMEKVVGKYPGQEMSPEKIVRELLGRPGGAVPENAVPILTHLRDNVFGANSREWASIRRAVISHMAETPAGGQPVELAELADRIERFLGNPRHANTILTPAEQAQLRQHAVNLRAAQPVAPAAGTMEAKIRRLFDPAHPVTGEQLISELRRQGGGDLAVALRGRLSPEIMGQIKQGMFKKITAAPEGALDWGDQKIGNAIANFLQTDLAQKLYTPNELQMLKAIGDAHIQMIPPQRTTNPSGSGYVVGRLAKGLTKQFLKVVLGGAHGVPGYIAAEGIGQGLERLQAKQAAARAADLFQGRRMPLPRQGQYVPQRVGAFVGQLPVLRNQGSQ
jgi:hypothetical protein